MRIPRDISGDELARALKRFGYGISHQVGSHMRLTTYQEGEHHVTIPRHTTLRIGTLHAILRDVAEHLKMERDELVEMLFGK